MPPETIENTVLSENTHTYGRTLNSARVHHFIIDGTRDPKEETTPVEHFLSAVSACCVQWLEQFAREDGVELPLVQAEITGVRTVVEPSRFDHVDLNVTATGPSQSQLEDFVARFRERCPLYGTLASATDVRFTVRAGA